MNKIEEIFVNHLKESINTKTYLLNNLNFRKKLIKIIQVVSTSISTKRKILTCGNGGSLSDAQHMTAEFMVRLRKNFIRGPIPSITLGVDSPTITAHTNDFNFTSLFSRGVEAFGSKNDCLIVFSTSGKSKNIIEALKIAKKMKIKTIGFLGNDGGTAKKYCNYSLIVPSKKTPFIQECHICLIHILVQAVEESVFKNKLIK
ncbi:SIS domain-containing protein [Alphaproteobacteria bacterium]|nr:SIS domain-containing protein [Alphaproteobacteria bacterium]